MASHSEIEEFFSACGGRLPVRVLLVKSDGQEYDYGPVERPCVFLGRSEQCDLALHGADVSHRHVYVQFVGGKIFCADLGSRTGIHWQHGTRTADWIEFEESIAIGPFALRFVLQRDGIAPAALERAGEVLCDRPEVELRFLNATVSSERGKSWPLRRTVTLLGHLRTCDIPLRHQSVSRVHASLVRTRSGLWVVDLMGREGIRVNGERVDFARLEEADVLEVGMFRMAVEYSHAAGTPAQADLGSFDRNTPIQVQPLRDLEDGQESDLIPWRATPQRAKDSPPRPPQSAPPPPGWGLSEQFVLSLLNHSTMMQQQMFDQQNQMMLMMMQMLSSMHSQHLDLVRDEMQQVRELTREMQDIQAELLRVQAHDQVTNVGNPSPEAPAPPEIPPLQPLPGSEFFEQPEALRDNGHARGDRDRPTHAEPKTSGAAEADQRNGSADPPAESAAPAERGRDWESAGAAERPSSKSRRPDRAPVSAPPERDEPRESAPTHRHSSDPAHSTPPEAELHAQLTHRLAELERKRNGYWQKIMTALGTR